VRLAVGQGGGVPQIAAPRCSNRVSNVQEVLRSNDPVRLSWVCALLADQHIEGVIFDSHTAILEGSAGAIVRRVMVADNDYDLAVVILREAGELPPPDEQ